MLLVISLKHNQITVKKSMVFDSLVDRGVRNSNFAFKNCKLGCNISIFFFLSKTSRDNNNIRLSFYPAERCYNYYHFIDLFNNRSLLRNNLKGR